MKAALAELQKAAEGLALRFVRGDYGQSVDGGNHAVEPLRLCLLRFLRGNSFNVIKALTQVRRWLPLLLIRRTTRRLIHDMYHAATGGFLCGGAPNIAVSSGDRGCQHRSSVSQAAGKGSRLILASRLTKGGHICLRTIFWDK